MQPLVLLTVLGSAFLHALWNAIVKREPDPEIAGAGVFVVTAATGAIVALVAGAPVGPGCVYSLGAGLFEAGYIFTLSRALALAPLGPVYTVSRGGALVLVWPISVGLLGETLSVHAVAGALLVGAGLAATGLGRGGRAAPRALALAGLTAANIAGYHICYKLALAHGGAPMGVFAVSLGVAAPLNLLGIGAAARARLYARARARPWAILAAGVLAAGSFLIFLVALAQAGAGAVFTLRNSSVVFAQILSWLLGEAPSLPAAVGALFVVAGAVLMGS